MSQYLYYLMEYLDTLNDERVDITLALGRDFSDAHTTQYLHNVYTLIHAPEGLNLTQILSAWSRALGFDGTLCDDITLLAKAKGPYTRTVVLNYHQVQLEASWIGLGADPKYYVKLVVSGTPMPKPTHEEAVTARSAQTSCVFTVTDIVKIIEAEHAARQQVEPNKAKPSTWQEVALRERVANLCHDQWSNWMRYMFAKGNTYRDHTFVIGIESSTRWYRQMNTSYYDLSPKEQDSDRKEANKFIGLIMEYVQQQAEYDEP